LICSIEKNGITLVYFYSIWQKNSLKDNRMSQNSFSLFSDIKSLLEVFTVLEEKQDKICNEY
jgi:hypothetical protein